MKKTHYKHGRYLLSFQGGFAFWDTEDRDGRAIFNNGRAEDLSLPEHKGFVRRILTQGQWTTGHPGKMEERHAG
jgi:hypothetical protein